MNYWLIKSEPSEYSFEDLLREGRTIWDGVRNFQAKRYLSQMAVGDKLFYYHSQTQRAIVGLVQVSRSAFPDPKDSQWVAVEIRPVKAFPQPVTLAQIKRDLRFADFALVRQARLSVMPVAPVLAEAIAQLAGLPSL
jgi:predicted RNA-binding protein with PUA-like domain